MSTASALLSSIAPAAPATSQGSAAVDASAFEGLLASMMGADMTGDGADDASVSTEKTDASDATLAGVAVPAQTLPPAPQPILLIVDAPAPEASATDGAEESATADAAGFAPGASSPADLAIDPPVEDAPLAALPVAPPVPAEAPTASTPLLDDKAVTGKTSGVDPQVRPAVKPDVADEPQVRPAEPAGADAKAAPVAPQTQPPVADDAGTARRTRLMVQEAQRLATPELRQVQWVDGALVEVAQPPAAPGAAATPAPETLPPAAVVIDKTAAPQVQPPIPAEAEKAAAAAVVALEAGKAGTPDLTKAAAPQIPDVDGKADAARPQSEAPALRPLAERSSRPVETNAAVDTAAPSGSAPTAAVSATPAAAQAIEAPAARSEAAVPVEAIADAADTTSDAPAEAPAPDAAPSAQTAQATRETLVPTMSRAAVEATAQIAAQILKRLDGRSTRFEMSLTPDDLGRVDIKLDIDSEGRLAARLAFDNPAAAADLKGRTDELRRQLEQQGFHLAEDAFEFSQRDSGSSAFDRGQDARQGQDRGQSRAFAAASRLNAETDTVAQPPRWTALSLTPAGVDMKV